MNFSLSHLGVNCYKSADRNILPFHLLVFKEILSNPPEFWHIIRKKEIDNRGIKVYFQFFHNIYVLL